MSVKMEIGKYGLGKAVDYVYRDPEKNMVRVMNLVDIFARGQFASQRAVIRSAITDPNHAYYP